MANLTPVVVLCTIIVCAGASEDAVTRSMRSNYESEGMPAGDPMKEMMDLMGDMMDAVTNTSNEFSEVGHHILTAIGDMADRIVSTEKLIDDMGIQIGWMADKIVHTEWIVTNMTRDCFCNHSISMATGEWGGGKSLVYRKENITVSYNSAHNDFFKKTVQNRVRTSGNTTWEDMIGTMEHALALMTQMSTNVSTLLNDEVDAIGTMADRIVATECLIMQMGKQIGVMADRIVYTEGLMANATVACCHLSPVLTVTMPGTPAVQPRAGPPCGQGIHSQVRRNVRSKSTYTGHSHYRVAVNRFDTGKADVDPFSWFAKQMENLMNGMMDEMEHLMTTMAIGILNGTSEIGLLADSIVDTEKSINEMGLAIGEMADCIVATEEIGFQMFSQFCPAFKPSHHDPLPHGKCAPIAPVHPVKNNTRSVFSNPAAVHATRVRFLTVMESMTRDLDALLNPVSDFTEMLNLCKKMVQMMDAMSKSMTGMASDVMNSIIQMSDRIMQTIGLINGMAGQINVMAGRIVRTEQLLAQLAVECKPPSSN